MNNAALLALARLMTSISQGSRHVTADAIARAACVTVRTARRWIATLETAGVILVTRTGPRYANAYEITERGDSIMKKLLNVGIVTQVSSTDYLNSDTDVTIAGGHEGVHLIELNTSIKLNHSKQFERGRSTEQAELFGESNVQRRKPAKKRASTPNPGTQAVVSAWIEISTAARGFQPTMDGRSYAAAKRLASLFSADEVREIIVAAMKDPWVVTNGTLATIASNPDRWRRKSAPAAEPPQAESEVPYHQPWVKPDWA